MTVNYTPNLGLGVPVSGAPGSEWVVPVNQNFTLLDRVGPLGGGVFTVGSMLFAGVGGIFSQDNANLSWDTTNKILKLSNAKVAFDLSPTFAAGVVDREVVYYDTANARYDKALADGTDKQKVAGVADVTNSVVWHFGAIIGFAGLTKGMPYYLSTTTAGAITLTKPTTIAIVVGVAKTATVLFIGAQGAAATSGGGGTGSGDVTFEDLIYHFILESAPFNKLYYDRFENAGTVTPGGTPVPTYSDGPCYLGSAGSIITSPEMLPAPNTDLFYRFFVHVEKDTALSITVDYTPNDGADWYPVTLDTLMVYSTGFSTLKIRITWAGSGKVYSFGTVYSEDNNAYGSAVQMFASAPVSGVHSAPYIYPLPGNAIYTVDGESLEVHKDGLKLFVGIDYEEVDDGAGTGTTINMLVGLSGTEKLEFRQRYGYVDASVENKIRLDKEHKVDGAHFYNRSGRNKIVNANFDVWQRGVTKTQTTTGRNYLADRWAFDTYGSTVTVSRQAFSLESEVPYSKYFHRMQMTNYVAQPALSSFCESVRTFAGKTVSLRLHAKADAARTVAVKYRQYFGLGGTPSSTVETAAGSLSLTAAWQSFVIRDVSIPDLTGKILGTDGEDNFSLNFILPTANCTIDIAQVQIEEGEIETEFELVPIAEVIATCERTYEKSYSTGVYAGAITDVGEHLVYSEAFADMAMTAVVRFAVRKRKLPSVVVYSAATGASGNIAQDGVLASDVACTVSKQGEKGCAVSWTFTGGNDAAHFHVVAVSDY